MSLGVAAKQIPPMTDISASTRQPRNLLELKTRKEPAALLHPQQLPAEAAEGVMMVNDPVTSSFVDSKCPIDAGMHSAGIIWLRRALPLAGPNDTVEAQTIKTSHRNVPIKTNMEVQHNTKNKNSETTTKTPGHRSNLMHGTVTTNKPRTNPIRHTRHKPKLRKRRIRTRYGYYWITSIPHRRPVDSLASYLIGR